MGASEHIGQELDATEFEQEVMKEIYRPNINQPYPEPRIYFEETDSLADIKIEPNIANTSTPSSTDVPWEWEDYSLNDIEPRPQPVVGVPRTWQPSPEPEQEQKPEQEQEPEPKQEQKKEPVPEPEIVEVSTNANDFYEGADNYDGDPILANMGIEDPSFSGDFYDGADNYDGDPVLANIENSSFYSEEPAMSTSIENSSFAGNWVEQQSSYDDDYMTPDEPTGPTVSTPDNFSL